MIETIKVQLIPNNKQKTRMFQMASVSRFAYNWAIAREKENHNNGNKFLNDYELRKEFTQLKSREEYKWLNNYSNNITKQAIKDACKAYKRFFDNLSGYPKFKSKKKSKPSFFQDNIKIKFTKTHVKLEKIAKSTKKNKAKLNWIRLAEHNRIPVDVKYYNPRITFDGLNFWISVGIEVDNNEIIPNNDGIGIDLGIKDLAICSNKIIYKNINKTSKVKKIQKKKRRFQRKISRKYIKNKKGESYKKTNNIIKSENKILKVNHRLTNIRKNYINQITTEIINRKPMFITVEDLNIKWMLKNKRLSKAVQEQCFYEFYRQLQYKCKRKNIELRIVDRFYPSSKLCHCCGSIKKDLKLSDRIYRCDCGYVEDRDYNASLNLRDAITYKIA